MNLKADFPLLAGQPELVYLDSAATSQKPQAVIDAVTQAYCQQTANLHRGIYDLGQQTTEAFETVRQQTAHFIGAARPESVIFTSGTTEGTNLIAEGWARRRLRRGDIIVTSVMEHHANFLPWLRLRDEIGIELCVLPIDANFQLNYHPAEVDWKRVKLIALSQASNVLGTINPVADIAAYAKAQGSDAKLLVDAAQSVVHMPVDVTALSADFLTFSAHKLYGPSGLGVLYMSPAVLEETEPLLVGGHMVAAASTEHATWAAAPAKFEAGTRNIEGTLGFGAALQYLETVGWKAIEEHEQSLAVYALERLSAIDGLTLFGPPQPHDRCDIFSFGLDNIHPHDVAEILNRHHIAVRAGHHCAQPLMRALGVNTVTRASLSAYNTAEDIDALITGLKAVKRTFKAAA